MRLKDKVAIVTGTSSGIGIGIAEVFAEEGAKVVCVARREKEGEAVAQSLRDGGAETLFIQGDVSKKVQVDEMVQRTLDTFGRIDVLVNNAGVDSVKAFEELSVEAWDRVIGVDLRGTFLCTKACIGQFLAQGSGNVVNIGSVHTMGCLPGAAAYDAAKWGVVGLTKSLAVEYAARGIRFNCLSPGLIDTQMWQDVQDGAEDLEACLTHWRANIPAGRVGTIREMGHVAAFLASDEASYVTGANLLADGGMTSQLVSKALYASKPLQRQYHNRRCVNKLCQQRRYNHGYHYVAGSFGRGGRRPGGRNQPLAHETDAKVPIRALGLRGHAVTIGKIPNLERFQVISNGKSRFEK